MKNVISLRDLEDMVRKGEDVKSLPVEAILTPSTRDYLRDLEANGGQKTTSAAAPPAAARPQPPAQPLTSKSPKGELAAFFNGDYCHDLKLQIVDIGRRFWQRAYVDGNGGNFAIRVGDDLALCTPTLVSKGFMKPEDMCLVDFEGNQLLGSKKRTSEILMHLQMMRQQPLDVASVHGDLGILNRNDVIIACSTSGKTREVIEMLELAHYFGVEHIIGITSHPDSAIRELSTVVINMGIIQEPCPLGLNPSASTTAMLALGDTLSLVTMELKGFTRHQYGLRHHAGYLGKKPGKPGPPRRPQNRTTDTDD